MAKIATKTPFSGEPLPMGQRHVQHQKNNAFYVHFGQNKVRGDEIITHHADRYKLISRARNWDIDWARQANTLGNKERNKLQYEYLVFSRFVTK